MRHRALIIMMIARRLSDSPVRSVSFLHLHRPHFVTRANWNILIMIGYLTAACVTKTRKTWHRTRLVSSLLFLSLLPSSSSPLSVRSLHTAAVISSQTSKHGLTLASACLSRLCLFNLFASREDKGGNVSLVPSQSSVNFSATGTNYCNKKNVFISHSLSAGFSLYSARACLYDQGPRVQRN